VAGNIRGVSISVVTVRDYEGVPSTRELYVRGVRFVINSSGDLEIRSAEQQPLGYYPSGNWLSVFVDDVVRIMVKGVEDTSIIGGQYAATGTTDAAVVAATSPAAVTDAVADLDNDDTDVAPDSDSDVELDDADGSVAELDGDSDVEPDSDSDADTEVEAAADTARYSDVDADVEATSDPDVDFGSEFHTEFDPTATAAEPVVEESPKPPSSIPAGMRSVKFGPRIMRPPKPKPEPTRSRHMMPVTFRARPIRAGLSKPTPQPKSDDGADGDPGKDETT
jgi:hypothetical protein